MEYQTLGETNEQKCLLLIWMGLCDKTNMLFITSQTQITKNAIYKWIKNAVKHENQKFVSYVVGKHFLKG